MTVVMKKEISVTQLLMAMSCEAAGLATESVTRDADRSRSRPQRKSSLLGLASHKLAAGFDPLSIIDVLRTEAPALCDDELSNLVARAQTLTTPRSQRHRGGNNLKVGETTSWNERQTGWTVFSKPARIETLVDDEGEYVLITDLTFPKQIRERHIERARLHGLVCYMQLFHQGKENVRIKLVIDSLVDESHRYTEWMETHYDVMELLREVQNVLYGMNDTVESARDPERNSGSHCFGCRLQEMCDKGRQFIGKRDRRSLPADLRDEAQAA